MKKIIKAGATSQTVDVFIQDSTSTTGAGKTGLAYNSAGLKAYYRKGATGTATAITLATQTVGGAYSSGGFVEIDATNMPGLYRLDVPNAAIDTAGSVSLMLSGATGMAPLPLELQVVAVDLEDGVRLGLTALPNAAAGANTGLPVVGTQVPNATAGASGGLLISGSNSGTTTLGALTVSGALTATGGIVGDITGNLSGSVGSVAVGGIAATSFASGAIDAASLATDAANEIRDAVFAKTLSELTGDPGATPTFADAVMLQHMALRNKRETDSSLGTDKLYNSAGSAILSATVSDTGTVFTKAKYA